MSVSEGSENGVSVSLRREVTCPHCWATIHPEELLWVASHPDLIGDPKLGEHSPQRFRPSRFTADGAALDIRDTPCNEIACPKCHLTVPRPALDQPPVIVSIAGTPSSGKSYFLAAMAWSLRQQLPGRLEVAFKEADPASNVLLNDYVAQQFESADRDKIVRLDKTEEQGDLYDNVKLDGHAVQLPKPFLFSVVPTRAHGAIDRAAAQPRKPRLLCLYDNAGESFLPGKDTASNRVTGHLWRSHAVLYLYDPTQDVRFRDAYEQLLPGQTAHDEGVTSRQETVLHEITARLTKHRARTGDDRRRPLVVVLTKYDQWWPLIGHERLPEPLVKVSGGGEALHLGKVKYVSDAVRTVVQQYSSELVRTADDFSDNVWYIPVSATGCHPERDPKSGVNGFRARRLAPMWESIPLLTALADLCPGLIPAVDEPVSTPNPTPRG